MQQGWGARITRARCIKLVVEGQPRIGTLPRQRSNFEKYGNVVGVGVIKKEGGVRMFYRINMKDLSVKEDAGEQYAGLGGAP